MSIKLALLIFEIFSLKMHTILYSIESIKKWQLLQALKYVHLHIIFYVGEQIVVIVSGVFF